MKLFKEILGYALGAVLFVGLMPFLMWLSCGRPALWPASPIRVAVAIILMLIGLSLSVWSIVYMRQKGDGNPMDAFGHELAPRTRHLMTDGPYRLSRNPMLSGSFLYLIGFCLWLWAWQALLVFILYVAVMMLQVRSEECRLRRDFGSEYDDYCRRTGRFFPKRPK